MEIVEWYTLEYVDNSWQMKSHCLRLKLCVDYLKYSRRVSVLCLSSVSVIFHSASPKNRALYQYFTDKITLFESHDDHMTVMWLNAEHFTKILCMELHALQSVFSQNFFKISPSILTTLLSCDHHMIQIMLSCQ